MVSMSPPWLCRDAEIIRSWCRDLRGIGNDAIALARPRTESEVAAALRYAAQRDWAVTPQGGNTSLVGGAVPVTSKPTMLLSLRYLDWVEDSALHHGWIDAGAGVTLAQLHHRLADTQHRFAVDFGSRDSATIGGAIATNAGGVRVLRHGSMRRQVIGLSVVLADGDTLVRLPQVRKDNTGFDWVSLLCGSEGALGVITAARLRVIPKTVELATYLVQCTSQATAFEIGDRIADSTDAEVVEYIDPRSWAIGAGQGDDDVHRLLIEATPACLEEVLLETTSRRDIEVFVATDASFKRRWWAVRDSITLALPALGSVEKFDVSVPRARRAELISEADRLARQMRARIFVFGHVGDDNLHLNLVWPASSDAASRRDLVPEVLAIVASTGGSISAEHGIGSTKLRYLSLARTPAEMELFERLKRCFDPSWMLNPGVLVPLPSGDEHVAQRGGGVRDDSVDRRVE